MGRRSNQLSKWDRHHGMQLSSLKIGCIVHGTVTNVRNDMVFVDFGAVRDGVLGLEGHPHPRIGEVLKGLVVKSVDADAGKVRLSTRVAAAHGTSKSYTSGSGGYCRLPLSEIKVGAVFSGVVTNTFRGKVFIDFGAARDGVMNSCHPFTKGSKIKDLKVRSVNVDRKEVRLEKEFTINDVLVELEESWGPCVALYVHGSSVFSNKPPNDIDLLAVVSTPTLRPVLDATRASQFILDRYEVSVYTVEFWLQKLNLMDLTMLTTLSLPKRFVHRELDWFSVQVHAVGLVPVQLYESIVSYAEYTWVLARERLNGEGNVRKSCKDAYFAFRVLELGVQLMEHGCIVEFHAANTWWDEVQKLYDEVAIQPGDWDVVEPCLANSFKSSVMHLYTKLKGALPEGQCIDHIVSPTIPGLQSEDKDPCAICLEPLLLSKKSGCSQIAVFVNCGHTFHIKCAARHVRAARAAGNGAVCPICRQGVYLGLDETIVVERDTQLRRNGRLRRYAGYPATVILE